MSEGERKVRGIVVAHGTMPQGLVDAVKRISGVGDEALVPVSNEGRSPDALVSIIEETIGEEPAIIFTDLASGSCALAARLCCRDGATRAMLNGVNLPMLLDFVFNRHLPMEELVPRLVEKGRDGLSANTARPITQTGS